MVRQFVHLKVREDRLTLTLKAKLTFYETEAPGAGYKKDETEASNMTAIATWVDTVIALP